MNPLHFVPVLLPQPKLPKSEIEDLTENQENKTFCLLFFSCCCLLSTQLSGPYEALFRVIISKTPRQRNSTAAVLRKSCLFLCWWCCVTFKKQKENFLLHRKFLVGGIRTTFPLLWCCSCLPNSHSHFLLSSCFSEGSGMFALFLGARKAAAIKYTNLMSLNLE